MSTSASRIQAIPSTSSCHGKIADFVSVYLGHALWRDMVGKKLFIKGDRDLVRSLPGWIELDKVVGRDFPVVRPAA